MLSQGNKKRQQKYMVKLKFQGSYEFFASLITYQQFIGIFLLKVIKIIKVYQASQNYLIIKITRHNLK